MVSLLPLKAIDVPAVSFKMSFQPENDMVMLLLFLLHVQKQLEIDLVRNARRTPLTKGAP
jgi:hypothetical protein